MNRAAVRVVVVAVWVAGLLVGTVTHVGDLVSHGPFAHAAFAPPWLDLYWSALAVLDPLTAVLLVRGRRAGVDLLLAVTATDLAANGYAVYGLLDSSLAEQAGLQRLLAFGGFVLVTAGWGRRAFSPGPAPAG
ncbi:hypothetical protein KV205_29740 [Streptomyces sp. SKN60]|uniref:hypothetical protein n=1 Tax=Streptomyces sp. SKN60 TaxID=2855506 RepID=UPI0022486B02|nr:hypothetical protein [Streptomyces sp. SKN60]MCX2184681.1 hypothetical protein [Streptomyces sp. SKN60]